MDPVFNSCGCTKMVNIMVWVEGAYVARLNDQQMTDISNDVLKNQRNAAIQCGAAGGVIL
ncbi:hypothetical protein GCM10011328_04480 [Hafnia psychrotolerans]|uniref:Uncharacterized protein n=1 Tax=Hafnia psychrotolerans TaxID=1477018 RepID=A0ABQ1FY40_9GAMM|nr:hypothetical protein GCM10011328_04480 [Hafnia psychrotolerans]